jgi:hypothetical protein
MASKYERLKARMRGVAEKTRQGVQHGVYAAETLGACALTAYVSGRMSDEEGEFGFKGVPYALLGSGVVYLGAMFAGSKLMGDLFAVGNGIASAHIGRVLYEYGVTAKNEAGTTGTRGVAPRQLNQQAVRFGTGFDSIRERMAA